MSFWENKNILITGATGFVGSNLMTRLSSLGAKVYGISRSESKKEDIYKVSILNLSGINEFVKNKKINICFHLAAEALVEIGQKDPYRTFKVNTEGTLNMLEIARKNDLKKIIIASSAHVYGKNKAPYLEEYTPRPSRPYETSKACTDLIAQSYADSFNLPVLIPRFVNIYGPGDLNFNRLIPKTIRSVLQGKNPEMWGGGAKREYLYIDDALDAYISLAKLSDDLMEKNRIYNFGSGELYSVKDLIERIIVLSEKKVIIERIGDQRSDEIISQYVSSRKANKMLRWKAKYGIDKGLEKTINWYESYL